MPVLSFGTGTFGGKGELFSAWGNTDVAEARRLVDICLEAGVNMFDTADIYSAGESERILGEAIKGTARPRARSPPRRPSASATAPNDVGSSRYHLLATVDAQLKRLGTDYIDLFQLHGFDAMTPLEEVLSTLDTLVRAGKIRYVGVSNFSGWHLMKSLGVADRYGYPRYVANQTYYSLIGRDYEWELMPLGLDQGLGAVVWSPLGWGRLTGKIRRGQPAARGRAACTGRPSTGRRSRTSTCSAWSTRSTRSPRRPARPSRRSRSTGCCSGRPCRPSSSARATRSSCGRTSAPSAGT